MTNQTLSVFHHAITITRELILQAVSPSTKNRIPHVILGLSGGPDSVFLLHVLAYIQQQNIITVSAAHLDHGWRETSKADATFCQHLCSQLNISYYEETAHNIALTKRYKGSLEALGRALRRSFFKQLAARLQADSVILAHHAQDQQETFFIRLLRGSTLDGLCSMRSTDGIFLRPLLAINKDEILAYLHENDIAYCSDPTNQSDAFLRNRIRNHLLPAINRCDTRFNKNFRQTLTLLQEENDLLHCLAQEAFNKIFTTTNEQQAAIIGHKKILESHPPALQKRTLILWLIKEQIPCTISSALLQEILRFLHNPRGGSHTITPLHTIIKKHNTFWITCTANK